MSNWYYTNKNGERIGVTGGQLKWLAKNGKITPETIVETEDGKTALARKVKGLTFITPESIPTESAPPEPAQPAESEIYGLAAPHPAPSPFLASMPETVNMSASAQSESASPFSIPVSETASPFTTSMPEVTKPADNPFTATIPSPEASTTTNPSAATAPPTSDNPIKSTLDNIATTIWFLFVVWTFFHFCTDLYTGGTFWGTLVNHFVRLLAATFGWMSILSLIRLVCLGDRTAVNEITMGVVILSVIGIAVYFGGGGGSDVAPGVGRQQPAYLNQFTAAERAEIEKFCSQNKISVEFFAEHIDVELLDSGGLTLLHGAAQQGNLAIAKILVSKGANVNARDDKGDTPLYCAALGSNVEVYNFLVSKGANVHAVGRSGDTPAEVRKLLGF